MFTCDISCEILIQSKKIDILNFGEFMVFSQIHQSFPLYGSCAFRTLAHAFHLVTMQVQ